MVSCCIHHYACMQITSTVFCYLSNTKLREMSILGHISVKLVDIDVNSHQKIARDKERRRLGLHSAGETSRAYMEHTRTSRFVVQAVLDEYQMIEASNNFYSLNQAQKASMAYDAR